MSHSIKRGDEVVVISGAHRGKRGKLLEVLRERNRVIVEGVAMIKRHTKARSDKERGGIIEREASIHRSNVMLASRHDARRQKAGAAAPAQA
ncbi:MAG: 50S ribosomal protein L24 [Opitutales bacterium]|jgi:large subunit ribosomal protein L24